MEAELGQFALTLALCLAVFQAVFPMLGTVLGKALWVQMARPLAQGQAVFVVTAFICLAYAFLSNDFSVQYVALHSNSHLPAQYRFAAVWGGHEGSLLLWVLMLSGWTLAVAQFSKGLPDVMVARVISVMGMISIGFMLFILLTSNPFDRLLPAAAEGRDLNPLLQDIGLIIHPPMLYMGYVGFSVAFALAIAAMLGGKLDATWARWSRPWTTAAWCVLTCGVALGSWWAYYELGWGGWWFWDPVENASFMPWLVGTALMHSLAITEKRGAFKSWTLLLAIAAFSLSLLGTFLVRSGVLTSVHAFATDPERGTFILIFLAIVVGSSLTLYAIRAPKIGLGGRFDLISRESALLANNILLVVAATGVLLGTLFPLVMDALGYGKFSVGPPYFDSVFMALMVPTLLMLGVGPLFSWRRVNLPGLMTRLRWAMLATVVLALIIPVVMGRWSALLSLGFMLSMWVLSSVIEGFRHRLRHHPAGWKGLPSLPRSYLGMQMGHLGVAVFIIGVTMVKGYESEQDVRMEVGDTAQLGAYTVRFDGAMKRQGPNYVSDFGIMTLLNKDGSEALVLNPEKRVYGVQSRPMTEAGIDTNLGRDLYISLGEPLGNGAWSVRLYYKPFVIWIWGGAFIMALGGILAISDRRYRIPVKKREALMPEAESASEHAAQPEPVVARTALPGEVG